MVDHRLAITLNRNHSNGNVWSFCRQSRKADRKFVLLERNRLARSEQTSRFDLGLEAAHSDHGRRLIELQPLFRRCVPRPIVNMEVDDVAFSRVINEASTICAANLCTVDSISVAAQPLSDILQDTN